MNKDGVTGFWPVIFIILTTFWPIPQLSQFFYDRVTSFTQTSKTGTNFTVLTLTSDGDLLCTNLDTQGSTQNPKPSDYPSWPQFPHTLTNLPFVAPFRPPTQPILYESYLTRPQPVPTPHLAFLTTLSRRYPQYLPQGTTQPQFLHPNGQLDLLLFDHTFRQPMPHNPPVSVFSLTCLIPNPPIRNSHWMLSSVPGIN